MRRWLKRLLGAGVVAGAVYAIWRVLDERSRASDLTWTAQPFPSPPRPEIREPADEAPAAAPADVAIAAWVEPDGDACPATHPVKAKLASGIYHEPGGQMYDRTTPDRCYRDADAAITDGLRVQALMELDGRSAIVTGGAGGLGGATVRRLVSLGVGTVAFDMDADGAAALADELGPMARGVGGSVLDDDAVQAAIEAAADLGALSIVVNVAGGGVAARTVARDGTPHDLESFRRVVELNLVGSFNVTRLAAAVMANNEPDESGEQGLVVHTASIAAFDGQIGQVAYAAAKSGLVGLTLPMARDLAAVGIRVMTVAPGTMGTPRMMGAPEKIRVGLASQVPHPNRLGQPDEFAMLVEHFARNAYLNGTTIRLDGAVRFPPK